VNACLVVVVLVTNCSIGHVGEHPLGQSRRDFEVFTLVLHVLQRLCGRTYSALPPRKLRDPEGGPQPLH
jgi:hypothetical protein